MIRNPCTSLLFAGTVNHICVLLQEVYLELSLHRKHITLDESQHFNPVSKQPPSAIAVNHSRFTE